MIDLDIPGFGVFALKHLVLDYNGTLAVDGNLLPGARELLGMLAEKLEIHVITADTFGLAKENLAGSPVSLTIIPEGGQIEAKRIFIEQLGPRSTVAIGNGRNDSEMLRVAAVGVFVVHNEGGSVEAMKQADVIATNFVEAFDLLRYPKRLVATLRS
jgi:soluble P-type ATPase